MNSQASDWNTLCIFKYLYAFVMFWLKKSNKEDTDRAVVCCPAKLIRFRIGGTHNTEYSDGKFSPRPFTLLIFLLSKLYRPKSQNTAQVSVLTSWHDSIFFELLKLFQYETYKSRLCSRSITCDQQKIPTVSLLPVTNEKPVETNSSSDMFQGRS